MNAPHLLLWLIGRDPALAQTAVAAGVDRVLVDLERMGKAERQTGRSLFLSDHDWTDIPPLRSVLPSGCLHVRLNPWHAGTPDEIERALALGADGLMLPYFRDAEAPLRFAAHVDGRATVTPLVETLGAVRDLPHMLAGGAIREFHVGLNDLALDSGRASLHELWGDPLLDEIASAAQAAEAVFGIGGVTDPRVAGLATDPRYVISEHRRLGSTRALLGRSFRQMFEQNRDAQSMREAVLAIRSAYAGGWMPREDSNLN